MKIREFVEFHKSSYPVAQEPHGHLKVKVFTFRDIEDVGPSTHATGEVRRYASDNRQVQGQLLQSGDVLVYVRGRGIRTALFTKEEPLNPLPIDNPVIASPTDFLILRASGETRFALYFFLKDRDGQRLSSSDILNLEIGSPSAKRLLAASNRFLVNTGLADLYRQMRQIETLYNMQTIVKRLVNTCDAFQAFKEKMLDKLLDDGPE